MKVRFLPGVPFLQCLCYTWRMDKFKYQIVLTVEVEAFDDSDAWDAVQDAFGIGTTGAVTVTDCEYKEKRARKR